MGTAVGFMHVEDTAMACSDENMYEQRHHLNRLAD